MLVLIILIFGAEMLGVFGSAQMVTLTLLIKSYLPMPIRIMVWSWLGWHLIVSDIVVALGGKLPLH